MRRTLFLAVFLFLPPCSRACSCGSQKPICSVYWQDGVIFRGKVVEQTLVSPPETTVRNLDGSTSKIYSPGYYRVRFAVFETLRGNSLMERTVLTNEQSSACGFPFEEGGEYLVFASAGQEPDQLWTSKCARTRKLEPGKEDADITWMRALPSAPHGATIFGRVLLPTGLEASTLATKVNVKGREDHDAPADREGNYSLKLLSPGEYTVSVAVGRGFVTDDPQKVIVADKGCAQLDWLVSYDGHVRGRISDAAGHALTNMYVVLERRDSGMVTGLALVRSGVTDSDGRYDFSLVPPGEYLVSANNLGPSPTRPYPRVYYRKADSDAAATGVHVEASGITEHIEVTLPSAWTGVTVHARVLQPDGSPATGADVEAVDVDYAWTVEPAMATAGENGDATLKVYDGRIYYLTATISGGTQQRCAGPLRFSARDGARLDAITIEHNWGNCLAQLNPDFRPPR